MTLHRMVPHKSPMPARTRLSILLTPKLLQAVASWHLPHAEVPLLRKTLVQTVQSKPWEPDPKPRISTDNDPPEIPPDPDAPGGEVYETVKQLMKLQNLEGDPQDFIPGYKKELATVTKMRLKEVSPAVAKYVREKKLAVRLRKDDPRSEAGHAP